MQYISTKQLRLHFPQIRAALARGEEYILIHRSQPIAKLVPLKDKEKKSAVSEVVNQVDEQPHITTHILHKPLTLPVPAGYSHPIAFTHLKIDLKEVVNLTRPTSVL